MLGVSDNVWPGISRQGFRSGGRSDRRALARFQWLVRATGEGAIRDSAVAPVRSARKGNVTVAQSYPAAVCDSEAAGSRWVISLDDSLRAGLAAGNSAARDTLKQIGAASGFFRNHREWKAFHSLGVVGVISDFTGENFEMSGEILEPDGSP